jgi:hypothetical protein
MRRLITTLFVAMTGMAWATVLTVSNNPDHPAQYTQVDPAIAASSPGDTIYVYGSLTPYSAFTITKKLVVIGAGYNSNNQFKLKTSVDIIDIRSFITNADGSVIMGFEITNVLRSLSPAANNVTITRNRFLTFGISLEGSPDGWKIYNNIIRGPIRGGSFSPTQITATNTAIQNNIIIDFQISGFAASSTLIDHNIFIRANNLNSVWNATITNNIFIRSTGNIMDNTVSYNSFSNNLSILSSISSVSPTNSFASNENTASGNLVNVDPQFENVTDLDEFNFNFNYRLRTGSPARNAGTNGTDLGIYAAPYPFPSGGAPGSGFDTSALPPIPQVTEMTIQNATVQPGAPLNVNVKARVNN